MSSWGASLALGNVHRKDAFRGIQTSLDLWLPAKLRAGPFGTSLTAAFPQGPGQVPGGSTLIGVCTAERNHKSTQALGSGCQRDPADPKEQACLRCVPSGSLDATTKKPLLWAREEVSGVLLGFKLPKTPQTSWLRIVSKSRNITCSSLFTVQKTSIRRCVIASKAGVNTILELSETSLGYTDLSNLSATHESVFPYPYKSTRGKAV